MPYLLNLILIVGFGLLIPNLHIACINSLFLSFGLVLFFASLLQLFLKEAGGQDGNVTLAGNSINILTLRRSLYIPIIPVMIIWILIFLSLIYSGASYFLHWGLVDPAPLVTGFEVQILPDGKSNLLLPGQVLQIKSGQQIFIQPVIKGECSVPCDWSIQNGFVLPVSTEGSGKCAITYQRTDPAIGDILAIRVRSFCKTFETQAGLLIAP